MPRIVFFSLFPFQPIWKSLPSLSECKKNRKIHIRKWGEDKRLEPAVRRDSGTEGDLDSVLERSYPFYAGNKGKIPKLLEKKTGEGRGEYWKENFFADVWNNAMIFKFRLVSLKKIWINN